MLVSFRGVIMSGLGMFGAGLVVALLMMVGRRVVSLGGIFVVLGCLLMRFVCHR